MFSFITDPLLFFLLHRATADRALAHFWGLWALGIWMLFTKLLKLVPHFCEYPQDLLFIPVTIVFGYVYGVIKLYALFTLSEVCIRQRILKSEANEDVNRPHGVAGTWTKRTSGRLGFYS